MKTFKNLIDGLHIKETTFKTGSTGYRIHGKVVDENGVVYQLCGANLVKVNSKPN